ncbi:hypothetical protein GTV32_17535 [Gordonia sp. SID5947]|uniref:MFS transporter n=1 Tax=Gordonia sp. SID5947 TaxID=2690315 RepID=UPI0013691326|nr:MFS transporter [Gordonia sp. SID5947]MYR07989.1 hypothetical protein [Gordonia sp. SID5947]
MLGSQSLRERALTLDALLQEIIFLGAPLIVVAANAAMGPTGAIYVSAASGGLGTLVFALSRAARSRRGQRVGRKGGQVAGTSPWRLSSVRTVAIAFFFIGGAFNAVMLVFTALGDHPGYPAAMPGYAMAALSVGSLLGGLWASSTPAAPGRLRNRLLWALSMHAVALFPLLILDGQWVLLVAMAIAGLPVAPALGSAYALVGELASGNSLTESFAWLSSALMVGSAVGAAVAGMAVDKGGPAGAAAVTLALAVGAALTVLTGWPHLRGATEAGADGL